MTSCTANPPSSCPCTGCRDNTAQALYWTNTSFTLANWNASGAETSRPLSYDFSTVSLTARGDATSEDGMIESCLAGFLENAFLRVAAREASIDDRIGFEYAAFQGLGNYVQWPALQWCPSSYDPRFRPWYVSAASGPKDVVIVLDISGSMRGSRMTLQIAAAKRLLNTFTSADYVGVVAFSSSSQKALGNMRLVRVTDAYISRLSSWLDGLSANGGTNFVTAFNSAFEMLSASNGVAGATSSCTKAILFLSDGVADRWNADDHASVTRRASELGGVRVFTYGLGGGVDTSALKSI